MVQDTRKTPGAGAFKPVNMPEPASVEEDALGVPVAVRMRRRQAIAAIPDRWRIDDEWWRAEPLSRLYYTMLLASGQRLVVFKDLNDGRWYRQRY